MYVLSYKCPVPSGRGVFKSALWLLKAEAGRTQTHSRQNGVKPGGVFILISGERGKVRV